MLKVLFILGMAMLLASQPYAAAAQTSGPGDRALVGLANDSPRNYNCPRNDQGECMVPLLPETGGDFSALLFDRSDEVANQATHGTSTANPAHYYDETGASFVIILVGSGVGLCVLAALLWRQYAAARARRRMRRH